ncbi:MAG: DUF2844 domain-containing protein [Steroidobacteraceae bacterium]
MDLRITGTTVILAFSAHLLCAAPARAGLEGDAAQVLADGTAMQGVVQSTPGRLYDIQEITAGTGTRVREYLNRSGRVFAISWSGPAVPDMRLLLGSHYDSYAQALSAMNHSGLRGSMRVASSELVVESGGHMRAYSGRAYLPALIPPGVPLAEFR